MAEVEALSKDSEPDDISEYDDLDADPNFVNHSYHKTSTKNDTSDKHFSFKPVHWC